MTTLRRPARREDGALAVIVALLAVALFSVAALVVDLGLARDTRRQAQNAADAAALAAVNALYGNRTTPDFGAANRAAEQYVGFNFGVTPTVWAACTDDSPLPYRHAGTSGCISFESSTGTDHSTRPDRVRVRIPTRNLPTTLGRLSGVTQMSINAQAHAGLVLNSRTRCGICILGDLRPNAHTVQNGDITHTGGNIHFNGDVSVSSGGGLKAETSRSVTVQGSLLNSGGTVTGTIKENQPKESDPLAFLPMPDPLSVPPRSGSDPCVAGPGRYGAHSFNGSTCTLAPGLYVIAGSGATWTNGGSTTVSGTGVTLHFTCGTPSAPAPCATSGSAGATLDASGGGTWKLKAPTSGSLQGQLLMFGRNNTSVMKLKGNAGADLSGTIYAARGALEFKGAGCMTAIDSLIVARSLSFSGNPACLMSVYNGPSNVPMPPSDMRLTR